MSLSYVREHKVLWTEKLCEINEVLIPGDNGEFVKTWQIFVGVCNDGIFAEDTIDATEAFQWRCGMAPLGLVDGLTLACAVVWCMNHGILSLEPGFRKVSQIPRGESEYFTLKRDRPRGNSVHSLMTVNEIRETAGPINGYPKYYPEYPKYPDPPLVTVNLVGDVIGIMETTGLMRPPEREPRPEDDSGPM